MLCPTPQPGPEQGTKCREKDLDADTRQNKLRPIRVTSGKSPPPLCLSFLPCKTEVRSSTSYKIKVIMEVKVLINH